MVLVGSFVSVVRSSRLLATPCLAGPGIALSAVCAADLGSRMSSGITSIRGMTVPLCLRLSDVFLNPACGCCCSSAGTGFVMVSGSVAAAVWYAVWVAAACCWAGGGDGDWSGSTARV